jgi:hypothetical protein
MALGVHKREKNKKKTDKRQEKTNKPAKKKSENVYKKQHQDEDCDDAACL